MITEDEKARLRFELANANVQSIGRAQGRYATALLAFIAVLWAFSLVGDSEAVLHLDGLDLKADGLWSITPPVMLVLVLGYIGTLTAFAPALAQLHEAEERLFGSERSPLFNLDTHKNIIDYLARLQVKPWGRTSWPTEETPEQWWRRLTHLILPVVFAFSWITSYWAVHRSQLLHFHWYALTFDWACLVFQAAFSVRPIYRCVKRFSGAEWSSDVYN